MMFARARHAASARRIACGGLALAALLACEGPPGEQPGAVAERAPAPEAARPPLETAESPATAEIEEAEAVPAEIYYDLTQYEWYRRGEALVHQGREYTPAGELMPLPSEGLVPAGAYYGVTYYVRDDPVAPDPAADEVLYVPVFEGYWLPFTAPRR